MTQVIEEPYKWREQKERAIVSIEMPFNNIIDLIKAGRSADDFSNKRGINKGVIIWNDHFGIKDESNIPPCTKCWFIVATEFEEQKIYDYKKFLMNNLRKPHFHQLNLSLLENGFYIFQE